MAIVNVCSRGGECEARAFEVGEVRDGVSSTQRRRPPRGAAAFPGFEDYALAAARKPMYPVMDDATISTSVARSRPFVTIAFSISLPLSASSQVLRSTPAPTIVGRAGERRG